MDHRTLIYRTHIFTSWWKFRALLSHRWNCWSVLHTKTGLWPNEPNEQRWRAAVNEFFKLCCSTSLIHRNNIMPFLWSCFYQNCSAQLKQHAHITLWNIYINSMHIRCCLLLDIVPHSPRTTTALSWNNGQIQCLPYFHTLVPEILATQKTAPSQPIKGTWEIGKFTFASFTLTSFLYPFPLNSEAKSRKFSNSPFSFNTIFPKFGEERKRVGLPV